MLQGSYGKFGLTSAMFRRCNEFILRGHKCFSMTLDFTNDLYSIENNIRNDKEINEKLIFLNPFKDASDVAGKWSNKVSHLMQSNYLLCRFYKGENASKSMYYNVLGECINNVESEIYEINKVYENNILVYESFSKNQYIIKEKYYSSTGLCIAIREWDEIEKKQKNFLLFDYSIGFIIEYRDTFTWCTAWINSKILENQSDEGFNENVVICDGPGSAPKIKHIPSNLAKRYYVLHNNHKHANGKPTKRDEGNLKSMHTIDGIIALTPEHIRDLREEYPKGQFYSIPNFTKIKNIKKEDDYINNRIGFFGQLIDRKGVKDAIDTISILHYKYKHDAFLELYGIAPSENEKTVELYKNYAKEKKIEHLIRFNGYSNDVFTDMRKCSCVLFPSYSEAQGLTIIESLANGVPVVAYDCNYGPAAMIENSFNGYLVKTGDREGLAKNVLSIMDDNHLRKKLSDYAKTSAIKFSDSNIIYDLWLKAFKKTN